MQNACKTKAKLIVTSKSYERHSGQTKTTTASLPVSRSVI